MSAYTPVGDLHPADVLLSAPSEPARQPTSSRTLPGQAWLVGICRFHEPLEQGAERPRCAPRALRERRRAALAGRADLPGAVPRRPPPAAQRPTVGPLPRLLRRWNSVSSRSGFILAWQIWDSYSTARPLAGVPRAPHPLVTAKCLVGMRADGKSCRAVGSRPRTWRSAPARDGYLNWCSAAVSAVSRGRPDNLCFSLRPGGLVPHAQVTSCRRP